MIVGRQMSASRSVLLASLLSLVIALIAISPVFAHSNLVRSDPPPNSVLPASPKQVTLVFTEEVEPQFSEASVLDATGRKVDKGYSVDSKDHRVMIVGLPELQAGVFTVVWKALSAVDGHATSGSFPFGVGDVTIKEEQRQKSDNANAALPQPLEVLVRWANFLAQTIIMGGIIFALFVWLPSTSEASLRLTGSSGDIALRGLDRITRAIRFSVVFALVAAAMSLLLQASIIAGTLSLESLTRSALGILSSTRFGTVWISRLLAILIILYVVGTLGKSAKARIPWIVALILGGILLLTSSLISHNAATAPSPIVNTVSDWVHLVAVSAWVGGLFHFALTLRVKGSGSDLGATGKLATLLLRRFSSVAVVSLGMIGVTGLYSVWLEVGSLTALFSTNYGFILLTKLSLIAPIVALGALNQFVVFDRITKGVSKPSGQSRNILQQLGRFHLSLKTEAALGIIVLVVVGALTAVSPASQILASSPARNEPEPLVMRAYSEGVNFTLRVSPLRVGVNQFEISLTDSQGRPIPDVQVVTAKFKFLDRDTGEATATAEKKTIDRYYIEGTYLSFPGRWRLELSAKRTQGYDAIVRFEIKVPSLALRFLELSLPAKDSSPYGISIDGSGNVWFTETGIGKIAKFDPKTESLQEFALPRTGTRPLMLTIDRNGLIWMTETQYSLIVSFNPKTEAFKEFRIPTEGAVPGAIIADPQGNIWFTEEIAGNVGLLIPSTGKVVEFAVPTSDSIPIGITVDSKGYVWFTEAKAGKIGRLDPSTGRIEEYQPATPAKLEAPTVIVNGPDGAIWFTEHSGNRITRLDPEKRAFNSYVVPNDKAFPYGMAFGQSGRLWYVEHIGNAIGTLDTTSGTFESFSIPTPNSDVQLMAVDGSGNVWFPLPAGNKLSVLTPPNSGLQIRLVPDPAPFTNLILALATVTVVATVAAYTLGQRRMKHKAGL